jgi:hypothetical protein
MEATTMDEKQGEALLTEDGQPRVFDLGHRGDFDYTQIARCLALTPLERLERHESWRLFVKEALENARLRKGHSRQTGASTS